MRQLPHRVTTLAGLSTSLPQSPPRSDVIPRAAKREPILSLAAGASCQNDYNCAEGLACDMIDTTCHNIITDNCKANSPRIANAKALKILHLIKDQYSERPAKTNLPEGASCDKDYQCANDLACINSASQKICADILTAPCRTNLTRLEAAKEKGRS